MESKESTFAWPCNEHDVMCTFLVRQIKSDRELIFSYIAIARFGNYSLK